MNQTFNFNIKLFILTLFLKPGIAPEDSPLTSANTPHPRLPADAEHLTGMSVTVSGPSLCPHVSLHLSWATSF